VLRRIEELDPAQDYAEIYRLMGTYEFPWDMTQALSFAVPHLRRPEHRRPPRPHR